MQAMQGGAYPIDVATMLATSSLPLRAAQHELGMDTELPANRRC